VDRQPLLDRLNADAGQMVQYRNFDDRQRGSLGAGRPLVASTPAIRMHFQ
jgi:hypothetical protein